MHELDTVEIHVAGTKDFTAGWIPKQNPETALIDSSFTRFVANCNRGFKEENWESEQ